MRAILVSVDYADLLSITLPRNRGYFEEMLIVTAPNDLETLHVAVANRCQTHITTAFYEDGAEFNKFKALEEGLDRFGREGWLCIMDADVLWPKDSKALERTLLQLGYLYGPLRRMCVDIRMVRDGYIPLESEWQKFDIHRNVNEWAGYSQIFHADDPHLGKPPWHEVDWRTAGGPDSFFQAKWPKDRKVRLPFYVLHIGEAGKNWAGRTTPYLDGSVDQLAGERYAKLQKFMKERQMRSPKNRFEAEKIKL